MIRPARAGDLQAIRELLQETGLALDSLAYDDFSGVVLVAEQDGMITGFIQALPAKPYAVITEMAVSPMYQHKGIGASLLAHLETVLMTLGCTAWAGYMRADNPALDGVERRASPTGTGIAFMRVF